MKKLTCFLKSTTVLCCFLFFFNHTNAQIVVRGSITISNLSALPKASIHTMDYNGFAGVANVYPLELSPADTIFFAQQADRDFVKNGIVNANITTVNWVAVQTLEKIIIPRGIGRSQYNYVKYAGRITNFYYYCDGLNNGYFTVNGLATKVNATFGVQYTASNKLYTTTRTYNGVADMLAPYQYQVVADSLATDLGAFNGIEFIGKHLANDGSFYFFLTRTSALTNPVVTPAGPVTLNSPASVTLTSSATSGNTWYKNNVAIPGAINTTYVANSTGGYSVKTTAFGFTGLSSNIVQVTVNTTPPPVVPLQVKNNSLTNHSGTPVILKGVNVAVYASGGVNDVTAVAAKIKGNTKANCARIIWESAPAVAALHTNNPAYNPTYYTYSYLDAALAAYATNHIVPVLCLHDLTDLAGAGLTDENDITNGFNKYVVAFWTDPNVLTVLKKYQNNLILNLQNEWGYTWEGPGNGFPYATPFSASAVIAAYKGLITTLRADGITCPIMIDAPDGGANQGFLLSNGATIIGNDPIKNMLLSVHTYWSTQPGGGIVNCPADYISNIDALASSGLPFVLGEVSDWAVSASQGTDVDPVAPVTTFACPPTNTQNPYVIDYDAILSEASAKGIGFIVWEWYQDEEDIRDLYDHSTGQTQNTPANAYTWPADILSTTKAYGLNNTSIVPVF